MNFHIADINFFMEVVFGFCLFVTMLTGIAVVDSHFQQKKKIKKIRAKKSRN